MVDQSGHSYPASSKLEATLQTIDRVHQGRRQPTASAEHILGPTESIPQHDIRKTTEWSVQHDGGSDAAMGLTASPV